ncbi:hypothetical protein NUSPORA_00664 [Nucleospora cyclopteri]
MKDVKGPRSALTDFLKEEGIDINDKSLFNRKEHKINKTIKNIKKSNRSKLIKCNMPVEMVNLKKDNALELLCIRKIMDNLYNLILNDFHLQKLSKYISENRIMNQEYFDYLCRNSKQSVTIYDCSMITDFSALFGKNLLKLELHLCGQINDEVINHILTCMDKIEVLRITGGYLLNNFNLPATLRVLDLTHCSRIKNTIIEKINKTYEHLDELRLSYCYNLDEKAYLSITVDHLYICETKLTPDFYEHIKDLKSLSVKRCLNINSIKYFNKLEYLNASGIAELKELQLTENIKSLNLSYCCNIRDFYYENLQFLNLSYLNLTKSEIEALLKLKNLKYLNLSWNESLNDKLAYTLLKNLKLEKFVVFGCFSLTKESAQYIWDIKDEIEVIGHPCETEYHLQ